MSQQLINHSEDLKRLRDEGYEIEIKSGFLLVHHIPYVSSSKEIKFGIFASELTLSSENKTAKPGNHVMLFQGEHPCNKDGSMISAIAHASTNQILFDGFIVNHSFSNKPPNGYIDYYHKVKTYADIISAPAKSLDSSVTERTFKAILDNESESIFNYIDSNSSRANILPISQKLFNQKIAIIGLGGTGAYILDLIAKCPVKEIHIIDGDSFLQHNAFRSPGAASTEVLNQQMSKVDYYHSIYSKMHKGIVPHNVFLNEENLTLLNDMSCVFISIDKGSIKRSIAQHLIAKGILFIDVGMGIERVEDALIGTLRVTTANNVKNDHIYNRIPLNDDPNDEYNSNIQIAELNSLNAALAVIKWKKCLGFYNDLENEFHTTYSINVSQLLNDEIKA
jgi:tRNA A37 threonylcarbamoyladenosine dehydratase